jgi:hypothetical protein
MEKIVTYQDRTGWADLFKKFGARDDVPDLSDDDVPSIVDQVWQAGPIQAALKSSKGALVVLDLSVPADDVDRDGEFYKAPRSIQGVSHALKNTSDAQFVKVLATLRRVFDAHGEEYEEAVAIVNKVRAEIRAETMATL